MKVKFLRSWKVKFKLLIFAASLLTFVHLIPGVPSRSMASTATGIQFVDQNG